jgi:6-phosphogluconolactonase
MRALRFSVLLTLAVAAAVAAAGGAAASLDGSWTSRVVGHVYVNDNTAPVNTIAGFDRHADGSLTPMAGSPFLAGGSGTGHPDASQGSLELSADGRYLLAVDADSNQISVLRIKPDGALRSVGSPVASGGVDPVSIGVHDDLVYVANAGPGVSSGDTNYTGFRLDEGGRLTPIPNSTYVLPNDAKPGQVLFNRDGRKLAGTRIATSQIDSFTVDPDGHLTPAPGSPYDAQASFSPPQGYGQLGSEFSPTRPNELFVSDAHTAAGTAAFPGLVSSFIDAPDGTLTALGAPVANDGGASCWIEISHDGRDLFVVNTASATISSYSIGHGGALTFLHSTAPGQIGAGAEDARLSPGGSTLWVVESGTDAVTGFTVNGSSLTPLASAAGPTGATPSGIVVD